MTERFGKKQSELQRWYLREWRKHRGMTQEQLAEAIDSAKPTISRMENGQIPYNQPFLEACAGVLNCSPADLLSSPPGTSDLRSDVVAAIQSLTPKDLEKVIEFVGIITRD